MIKIYSKDEIERIADSGKILAKVFGELKKEIKIGVSLKYLDQIAYKSIKKAGAEPAFLGYQPEGAEHPFPYTVCASINEVIVHGRPSDYKLKSGDVLKIDCGVKYKGYYSDSAFTFIIDKVPKEVEKLVKATYLALEEGIKQARAGNRLGDIGWAIENTAKKFGVKVIRELTGHGIGKNLHEDPTIYNFGPSPFSKRVSKGETELKTGMVLAIEPMFSLGADKIVQKKDESWATADGSLSAHFEHTVAITEKGSRILT